MRSRKHILVERELFKDKIRGVPNIMEKANYKLPKEGKEQKVQLKQSMEEITIKSMIKSMGKTYKETITDYVKNRFGSNTRIILSEQGFSSTYGGQANQAARIMKVAIIQE